MTAAIPDSLRLRLLLRGEARAKEPVVITLRVENIGSSPLDLYLRGRTIAFDLVVSRSNGTLIWRRLHDQVVPAILRLETIAPGASLELKDVWHQRSNDGELVAPGDYMVHGELLSEEQPLVTPAEPLRIAGN